MREWYLGREKVFERCPLIQGCLIEGFHCIYWLLLFFITPVLEVRVGEGVLQLEQDCYRLETYARKEIPQRRQEAKQ